MSLGGIIRTITRGKATMLEPGEDAPDFDVTDHHGNRVKLSDFRGRKVVLWFYPKADTPGWTREGSGFRDLSEQYAAKNTTVLGVSFDSERANAAFAQKYDFPFQLLCDTGREIGLAYGAADSPKDEYARRIAYVIDENGKIAQAHAKVDAASYPHTQLESL